MLPERLAQILSFFDACGYYTGSSTLSRHKKVVHFITFMHIFFIVLFTSYKVYTTIFMAEVMNFVEVVNESLQYTIPLFAYLTIILESLLHQYEHKRFWNVYQRILNKFCFETAFINAYINRFIRMMAPVLVISLWFSLSLAASFRSIIVFIIVLFYWIVVMICQIRVIYYLMCLEIVHFQIEKIDQTLKTIKCIPSLAIRIRKLTWIREYYYCVHEMTKHLHDVFGWSHVALILYSFYSFLTNVNWFYAHYHDISSTDQICEFRLLTFIIFKIYS